MLRSSCSITMTVLVLAGAPGSLTQGETAEWLAPVSGEWYDASNWSTADWPGRAGFRDRNAVIDTTGMPYTVSLDPVHGAPWEQDNTRLNSITLDSPDATLFLGERVATGVFDSFHYLQGNLKIEEGRLYGQAGGVHGRVPFVLGDGLHIELSGSFGGFDVQGETLTFEVPERSSISLHELRFPEGDVVFNLNGSSGLTLRDAFGFNLTTNGAAGISLVIDDPYLQQEGTTLRTNGSAGFGAQAAHGTNPSSPWYFVNQGTIISTGEYFSLSRLNNQGMFDASGVVVWSSLWHNEGEVRIRDGADLRIALSNNTPDDQSQFSNTGLIHISGEGSKLLTLLNSGFEYGSGSDAPPVFSNSGGTIRLDSGTTARLAGLRLGTLGTIERNPESTVELVGAIELVGGVFNRETLAGPVVLTRANLDSKPSPQALITGGTLDLSGEPWLEIKNASFEDLVITGGDLVLEQNSAPSPFASQYSMFDVTMEDQAIILGSSVHLNFDNSQFIPTGKKTTFNGEIRAKPADSVDNFERPNIAIGRTTILELGPDSRVSGGLYLGGGNCATRALELKGLVEATDPLQSLIIVSPMTTNEGIIRANDARLEFLRVNLENRGRIEVLNDGALLFRNTTIQPLGTIEVRDSFASIPEASDLSTGEILAFGSSRIRLEGTRALDELDHVVLDSNARVNLDRLDLQGSSLPLDLPEKYLITEGVTNGSIDFQQPGVQDAFLYARSFTDLTILGASFQVGDAPAKSGVLRFDNVDLDSSSVTFFGRNGWVSFVGELPDGFKAVSAPDSLISIEFDDPALGSEMEESVVLSRDWEIGGGEINLVIEPTIRYDPNCSRRGCAGDVYGGGTLVNEGVLSSFGTITGALENRGTMIIADGDLFVSGKLRTDSFDLESAGVVLTESSRLAIIAGLPDAASKPRITTLRPAEIGGLLVLDLASVTEPGTHRFIEAPEQSGSFTAIELIDLDPSLQFIDQTDRGFYTLAPLDPAAPCSVADQAMPYYTFDAFDFFRFVNELAEGDASSDLVPDEVLDDRDVFEFLLRFEEGCEPAESLR